MKKINWKKIGMYILYYICLFGVFCGSIMIIGGVGNLTCADEALTKAEEIRSYLITFLGFPVTFLFGKLAIFISENAEIGYFKDID